VDALQQTDEQITALGASLVAISPQLESFNREMSRRQKLTFDVLSDHGNRVATEFGLTFQLPEDLPLVHSKFGIDLKKYNGDDSWTLPIPARFVSIQAIRFVPPMLTRITW
jgi:peroxiredoxin